MPTLAQRVRLQLADENPEAVVYDNYDAATVGICRRFGMPPVVLYDYAKCIKILVAGGMTEDEAEEYFEFNTMGCWAGDSTPCFLDTNV